MKNCECELFRMIPEEKINRVFEISKTAGAELDYEFLGFEEVYKAVTLFVPKSKIIIDFGCAYAFQSWYFRAYRKYIGIDNGICDDDILKTENSEFYFTSIQDFIENIFQTLGYKKREIFAICSYVPDADARRMVRENFPYCLVYYPEFDGGRNEKLQNRK